MISSARRLALLLSPWGSGPQIGWWRLPVGSIAVRRRGPVPVMRHTILVSWFTARGPMIKPHSVPAVLVPSISGNAICLLIGDGGLQPGRPRLAWVAGSGEGDEVMDREAEGGSWVGCVVGAPKLQAAAVKIAATAAAEAVPMVAMAERYRAPCFTLSKRFDTMIERETRVDALVLPAARVSRQIRMSVLVVVETCLQDDEVLAIDEIDQPMLLRDAP